MAFGRFEDIEAWQAVRQVAWFLGFVVFTESLSLLGLLGM